ncbi:MAG: MotA/TolQ/ExbB proton channel family protein [Nitrospiria bacterium]
MNILLSLLDRVLQFLEMGGEVLWGILFSSLILWTLVLERYWFIHWTHRVRFRKQILEWSRRKDRQSWFARKIRQAMISRGESSLMQSMRLIKTLTKVLPLLGLLGTVTGMIDTFDVMTKFGTGNARGMANGISVALVTTMAGLVTALSGLYFSADLSRRVAVEKERMADLLPEYERQMK